MFLLCKYRERRGEGADIIGEGLILNNYELHSNYTKYSCSSWLKPSGTIFFVSFVKFVVETSMPDERFLRVLRLKIKALLSSRTAELNGKFEVLYYQ